MMFFFNANAKIQYLLKLVLVTSYLRTMNHDCLRYIGTHSSCKFMSHRNKNKKIETESTFFFNAIFN